MRKILGIVFILVSIGIFLYVIYANSKYSGVTREFSPYTILSSSWEKYKMRFLNKDGRIIDYSENNITTSEGQSYALLRAVWMDDKDTFDLVWKWTKENLKRPKDNIFGWRWGKRSDGTYGFISSGDDNSASDADQDIALALIFASSRWSDRSYLDSAQLILADLWEKETALALGKRYLIAGGWAQSQTDLVINPSYFAPYAWRIFAKVDKKNDWESLINPAYELLKESGEAPLDKGEAVGIPPDWVVVDRKTGALKPFHSIPGSSNYSFDAVRVPWRIGLEYEWNKDERAKTYLLSPCTMLNGEYSEDGKLEAGFEHDGAKLTDRENPTIYATMLGCSAILPKEQTKKIYEEKIIKLYSNDKNTFHEDLPYYEQNWLWFGAALYNKFLISYQ